MLGASSLRRRTDVTVFIRERGEVRCVCEDLTHPTSTDPARAAAAGTNEEAEGEEMVKLYERDVVGANVDD